MLIYNKDELQYVIKVAMVRAREALNELKKAAEEYEADISGSKNMRKCYRMEFLEEEIVKMDVPTLRSQIQSLI